ncbi:MAG TPA: DUF721 domain-containing protein [Gammaproteobacteria bacterium]|jgi:hypothetical protein|nr:DUF721 domain-containing protein [Gammaproteobacteria bacterium]
MKDDPAKPVSTLLQPNHRDLQTVLSKVKAIQRLNEALVPLLDSTLRPHCQVANLTNGVLVILTTNGSAATQLRYQSADLLKKLHKTSALRHIKEIQPKVRPAQPVDVQRGPSQTKTVPPALMSEQTAQTLTAMAETIEDEELREIMLRIAGHVR